MWHDACNETRQQDLLSVDNDNGREGENGNRSITFMMNVKCDPSGAPAAKKSPSDDEWLQKNKVEGGRRRKRENLEVWLKSVWGRINCDDAAETVQRKKSFWDFFGENSVAKQPKETFPP